VLALTEKYKPTKLHDFAGLAGPRTILTKLAAAPYESAWLLVGPSGTGKTTMALAVAAAIGAELHHIPAKGLRPGNSGARDRPVPLLPDVRDLAPNTRG
jgi:replication-associated recombination protein RarA